MKIDDQAVLEAQAKKQINQKYRSLYKKDPKGRKEVRKKLEEDIHRVGKVSRDVYRQIGWFPETMINDLYGSFKEFLRAVGLEESRETRKRTNDVAKKVSEETVQDYAEEYIEPHYGKWAPSYRKRHGTRTVIVGSDFHGPFVDPFALRVWLDVVKMVQPDGVVFNGDIVDFPEVSRFLSLPGSSDLCLQTEIDFVREEIFKKTVEVMPEDSWRTYHLGNHEQRLVRYIAGSAPKLASLRCLQWDALLGLDDLKVELVFGGSWMAPRARDKKTNIKKTWQLYYDCFAVHHGISIAKNAWEKELQRFGYSGTHGHVHRPALFTTSTLAKPCLSWTNTGMLAGFAVGKEYVETPSQWNMAFGVFTINAKLGIVSPQLVLISEDFATFCGVTWKPTKKEINKRRDLWAPDGKVKGLVR